MIRTPLSRSKVKGQGHQAALLTAALTREAGAAVTVRTYWAWETTATLRLLGGARGAGVNYLAWLGCSLFLPQNSFWPSYCQISTDLDKILHTPIVVRNTLVGQLRPRSARGRSRPNQNDYMFNICNAP